MGTMDNMKDKAKDMMGEHGDEAAEKAGDFADDKTGGKHTDKIDRGVDKAQEVMDK
jgi:hypothetical protein